MFLKHTGEERSHLKYAFLQTWVFRCGLICTLKLAMQVVHVGDEAIVGQQETNSSQQHRKIDAMVTVIRDWLFKV